MHALQVIGIIGLSGLIFVAGIAAGIALLASALIKAADKVTG
jgi:hypothetical protein